MLQVDNEFKTMFQAGTWNTPSAKEQNILALETQIQKLQKKKKKPKQQEGARKVRVRMAPKRKRRRRKVLSR